MEEGGMRVRDEIVTRREAARGGFSRGANKEREREREGSKIGVISATDNPGI